MRSNHRTRLLALATEIVGRRPHLPTPLIVFDSPTLPPTPEDVIYHARHRGRPIFTIHFGDGNGEQDEDTR
jgi:hypothetical protein